MFLSSAIFLQGKRAGFFWFIALFVFSLIVHFSSIMEYKFSNITVIMMLVFLFAHYLVLLLYENQQNENSEKLEKEVAIQKEALANFKILINSTIEAVLVFDREEGIVECNEVGLRMFGYTKDEILGKDIFEFVYKDDIKLVQEMMKLKKTESYEIRGVDCDGNHAPVLVSGADMYYNSRPVRVVTIFDLTELKQKDKLLQLQSRHAVMGEMIGMIAHQWRQPLAAISGSTSLLSLDLMMDSYNRETFEKEIKQISEHTQFLSTTIDDFRNFFKENKQKSHTTFEEIIQSSLSIIGPNLESKNIEIIKEYQLDSTVYTYANELKQVVLNLIKNAQDILLEKKIENPKIIISTYKENNQFILIISDNGGGICADIVDNIFDPYFTTKEKRDGTGLGLYMSKTIIEEHCGGTISVSNGVFGAEFKIMLKAG
jgi:PAS domain S-box-containing protein